MPVARGMTKGKYIADSGAHFKTNVDNDFFADATMGWVAAVAGDQKLPRGFRPRHVSGLSATTGRRSTVRIPDVTADLWTGVATTWVGGTNIEGTDTYTVVDKINEKPSL